MKRNMVVLAALATLGVVGYLANHLGAQAPVNAPPAVAGKVGVINLVSVLKGYHKHKTYTSELDQIRLQYEKKDADLRKLLQDWKNYIVPTPTSKALTVEEKAKAETTIKDITRRIEDNIEEGKKIINKRADDMQVQVYKEIEVCVQSVAAPAGYQAIFLFSDADNIADRYTPQNIARKMNGSLQSAGVVPMYMGPGLDISADVVAALNSRFPAPAAATAPAGQTPATAPGKN